ncbi:hypothetical protein Pcar_0354 [Syntrophotalea carbinolica DSM 2380]|uniref:Uncharacterized protein n=2 Tax=Syntrophotalea carbinolica TaxID=19 RepID=Q3A7N0_SYNC1|nr:hypothetical protein Pcar_0354 [Syntrophotalea carbinolica DSM 2380]
MMLRCVLPVAFVKTTLLKHVSMAGVITAFFRWLSGRMICQAIARCIGGIAEMVGMLVAFNGRWGYGFVADWGNRFLRFDYLRIQAF